MLMVGPALAFTGKIGIMMRVEGSTSYKRRAAVAVLAVHHINTRNQQLVPNAHKLHPNFTLDYELHDTYGSPSRGIELAVDLTAKGIHYIVGAQRSAVSSPVSLVASTKDIPVISFSSTAPELSNKDTHPYFSRTIVHDETTALAITESSAGLGWKNFAGAHIKLRFQ